MAEKRKRKSLSAETRAKISAASKAALAKPEVRARMSARAKAIWADPERREKRKAETAEKWRDPEVRARIIAGMRKSAANPPRRVWMSEIAKKSASTPEEHLRRKQLATEMWRDPVTRAKMLEGRNKAADAQREAMRAIRRKAAEDVLSSLSEGGQLEVWLVGRTGWPPATVKRACYDLAVAGLIVRHGRPKRWSLKTAG